MSKLIIIPGAGSSQLNWLDQLIYFEEKQWQKHFLHYQSEKYLNFHDCANALAINLTEILKAGFSIKEDQIQQQSNNNSLTEINKNILIAHSMGAMLLLKILTDNSNSEKLSEIKALLKNTNIFLIQPPARTNTKLLKFLKTSQGLISTIMKLHQPLKEPLAEWLREIKLKNANAELLAEGSKTGDRKFLIDLIWILAAMHISAWGTHPQVFKNLMNYYEEWEKYSPLSMDDTSVLWMPKDFNINITVSNSDIFCDKNDSLKLAELLNAKVKEFDWTFHNPMHFPWSQKEFHDWLLESSQYGTE
jgi:predicted alpha/beta hydrolase family esterase